MQEPTDHQQQPPDEEELLQILVLDKNPDEPLWMLATVVPTGAWLARLDSEGQCKNWPAITAWVEDTIRNTAELVPLSDVLAWRVRGMSQPPGSTAVLRLVPVPGLPEPIGLIMAFGKDGQSKAAGVLVFGYYEESVLGEANALAQGLGLKPAGHWRLSGPFGAPEFYPAEPDGALSWPAFLVSQGIDLEDEEAIAAILNAE